MADAPPVTRLGATARIGFLADTHCHEPGAQDLPPAVLDAFRGVDLVVHLGDMGEASTLERLATVAPVIATRGQDDPPADPRIAPGSRVIEGGGVAIGALFDLARAGLGTVDEGRLSAPGGASPGVALARVFARSVDVVAFGGTHRPLVAHHAGVLFVNPGSPNLPDGAGVPGTVAVLALGGGVATVEIVRIAA
jgi:putative phosphoesterase